MKKIPDFSRCKDPEFALLIWKLHQELIERERNNPFLKIPSIKEKTGPK